MADHYPVQSNGRVRIFPSQALETFWCDAASSMPNESWVNGSWSGPWNTSNCIENDAPTLAALHVLCEKLLALPPKFTTQTQRALWTAYAAGLPPLPTLNNTLVSYANEESFPPSPHNMESPQLYSVHPFRQFTVGRSKAQGVDLTPALNAASSGKPGWGTGIGNNAGWGQQIMNNALLGRAEAAAAQVVDRSLHSAVPGMRSRAYAWGGVCGHPPAAGVCHDCRRSTRLYCDRYRFHYWTQLQIRKCGSALTQLRL